MKELFKAPLKFVTKHQKLFLNLLGVFGCVLSYASPVFAAEEVTNKLNGVVELEASVISSIGSMVALWGFFEMGMAMQSNEGTMQSASFKRIAGGVVCIFASSLLLIVQK